MEKVVEFLIPMETSKTKGVAMLVVVFPLPLMEGTAGAVVEYLDQL